MTEHGEGESGERERRRRCSRWHRGHTREDDAESRERGVFKRALVGSLSINNHPYILTLEPSNEKVFSHRIYFLARLRLGW